jgi:excisionase family DNA binding protein
MSDNRDRTGDWSTRLLTAAEVADTLRVSTARVYELVRRQMIPALRLGERQVRFDEAVLRDWIACGGSIQLSTVGFPSSPNGFIHTKG